MLWVMGVMLVAFIVLPMLEWLKACAVTLGVAADVVVTLVSVVPVVLGAPLDVCGVVVTAAVTLELTVIVSIVAEVLVVR